MGACRGVHPRQEGGKLSTTAPKTINRRPIGPGPYPRVTGQDDWAATSRPHGFDLTLEGMRRHPSPMDIARSRYFFRIVILLDMRFYVFGTGPDTHLSLSVSYFSGTYRIPDPFNSGWVCPSHRTSCVFRSNIGMGATLPSSLPIYLRRKKRDNGSD